MMLYIENPKDFTKKLLEWINKLKKKTEQKKKKTEKINNTTQ